MATADGATWLFGLDIGSTTTHSLAARTRVLRNCVTGRMELGEVQFAYQSETAFTPFRGEDLDEVALRGMVHRWIQSAGIHPSELFAGGAIVTGLAAQAK